MPSVINKPKTSLRGLRTFCAAARHQSFRIAGEELFITSSAVSHQIKNLETELGKPLFDRKAGELSLTDIGRSLFEDIDPLIEQLDAFTATYKAETPRTSVRVSVQPFFASEYFVPRLSEFTAQHPEIDIQVGTSDETSEKHPASAELSIRLFRKPPADLSSHLLFPLRMVPAGSPEFKKKLQVKGKKIVSEFPLIVYDTPAKAWTQWSKSSGIQLPEISKITRLDSMIAVVRAAERGIGAALVPIPIAEQWFKQKTIVRLFDEELVADLGYYLTVDETKERTESAKSLRNWILQEFTVSP